MEISKAWSLTRSYKRLFSNFNLENAFLLEIGLKIEILMKIGQQCIHLEARKADFNLKKASSTLQKYVIFLIQMVNFEPKMTIEVL